MAASRALVLFEIVTTTLTSQLYALGLCNRGPLVAVGLVCGNGLVAASLQSAGFDAVVSGVYGISCVAFSTMELVSSVVFISVDPLSRRDLGLYAASWGWVNAMFALRSIRVRKWGAAAYFGLVSAASAMGATEAILGLSASRIPAYIIMGGLIFPFVEMSKCIIEAADGGETRSAGSSSVDTEPPVLLGPAAEWTGLSIVPG